VRQDELLGDLFANIGPGVQVRIHGLRGVGTRLALANSQPGADPPGEAHVPRWGWGEAPPYTP
jgi:hypothetical protein